MTSDSCDAVDSIFKIFYKKEGFEKKGLCSGKKRKKQNKLRV